MIYRLISIVALMISLVVSGCASKEAVSPDTVTVWHWMSDREAAFNDLAEQYTEQTGVPVRFDLYAPSEAYTQKVKAAAQTKTLPDVFGVLGESRDLASFIKSGYVADISSLLGDANGGLLRDTLFEKAVGVNQFQEGNEYGVPAGTYGVPLDVSTIQMVYNKKLFAKAGLDPENPPHTWDDFVRAARALKEKDIPVFVSGFGEIWMLDAIASNWAMNLMGEEKVFDTYRGKVPYTDPDWVRVLELFKQMADEGIIVPGAVTMVNKAAEQMFAIERAAFAFNGSWCVNVYEGMNPELEYGAMLPPRLSNVHPMKVWGGAGSSLMVNNQSKRKDEAMKFLHWLISKDQQAYLANATNNLPANRMSLKDISPVLSQFADDIDNTTHPNIYPVHENNQVSEAWTKGIQSVLIGEKTPEQIAADVQVVKEKIMKKAR